VSCTHTQRPFHCKHSSLQSISSKPSLFDLVDTSNVRKKALSFRPSAASVAKNIHLKYNIPNEVGLLSQGGGEDSYFLRADSLGVAYGVGGWVSVKGANSALYSRMLMHYASMAVENYESPDFEVDPLPLLCKNSFYLIHLAAGEFSPKHVLTTSYQKMKELELNEGLVGSTTAIIAHLENEEMSIANIGDGGIMVLRNYDIIFRSEEQQHSFNYPFRNHPIF
jgi:hypothetical protein